jgi:membrane protein
MMQKIKNFWQLLKDTGAGFGRHKVLKLSASLAYYTVFSIGPMLLVVIFFSNLFWGRQAIEGKIYSQISGMVGDGAALQIQEILKNASVSGNSFTALIGFVTLIVAATTAFIEMQDSINMIWNLRVKKNTGLETNGKEQAFVLLHCCCGFITRQSFCISEQNLPKPMH